MFFSESLPNFADMLSDFQQQKLLYLFRLLDLNNHGYLELGSFSDICERIREKLEFETGSKEHKFLADRSVKFFHRLLGDIPHDDNQTIKPGEWLLFFDRLISTHDEEEIDEYTELIMGFLFDLFDDNNDGYISAEEYADLFLIYGIDTKYSVKAFINLDLNEDGRLSRYELLHALETFLTSQDPTQKGNWIFGNWEVIEGAKQTK